MKIYLISNNLVVNDISYETSETVEEKRISRPLSIEGEKLALKISSLFDAQVIYSSNFASAIGTSKYIAKKNNTDIKINSTLNDSLIGVLGNRNIQMLRFMQERDFDYKFPSGESLNETKERLNKFFKKVIYMHKEENVVIVSNKRAFLALLSIYCKKEFDMSDRLVLTFNDCIILSAAESDVNMIEITLENGNIKKIDIME
ncbi:MAG: histidine phosphatase family protein [Bacilli bacterium]